MIPFITCEISLLSICLRVGFDVNVFDLDFRIQIDSIEQSIKSNSVGPGNMSHCRTSVYNNLLDHYFVVFKHIQQSFLMRRVDVWGNKININQIIDHSLRLFSFLNCMRWWTNFTSVLEQVSRSLWLWFVFQRTATIRSHKSSAGISSNLNPVFKEMISDSVELCETEVCFLHIQLIGTNAWLPKMHDVPPDVDFESSRSLANSESWNSSSLHCLTVFSHITILFVFTCMIQVRDQKRKSFVTSFGPFCDRSCKFIH